MKRSLLKFVLTTALAMAAAHAGAVSLVPLLKNTPAERFDERDMELFIETVRKVLGDGKIGDKVSWANPESKSNGSITVLAAYESKGMPCRRLEIENQAAGRKGTGRYNLCQTADKKWTLGGPPPPKTNAKPK